MNKSREPAFIGIVEFLLTHNYTYCVLFPSGAMHTHKSVKSLGDSAGTQFKRYIKQETTFNPPEGVRQDSVYDPPRKIHETEPLRYHRLSVLEQTRFERTVVKSLHRQAKHLAMVFGDYIAPKIV